MILSGKNEENKSMKKAKRCLIAVVSGVLVATAVLSGCGQSKKEVSMSCGFPMRTSPSLPMPV